MNVSQQNPTLFVVTRPSLQAKALVKILASSLPVTVLLHNISHPVISPPDNALILYDRTATNEKYDLKWQLHLKKMTIPFKLLLIDDSKDKHADDIFDWPSVRGLFCMADDHHSLIHGIGRVLQNEAHMPDDLRQRYQDNDKFSDTCSILTEREKAILNILREGASNNEIADSLFISKFTVKAHLYNIFKKIEVKNRTQAAHWANENM